jgi:hypothetical protein
MAISVDPITGEITIPKADLSLIQASPEIRGLDVDAFRLELKDWEASADGRPWPDTHVHNTQVLLAGTTFARTVEIIDPYFVTIEDGQYAVEASGANHNIADVLTVNQVSFRTFNSGGLIVNPVQSGLTAGESADLETIKQYLMGGRNIDYVGNDALGWQRIQRDENDVEVARYNLFDQDGNRITGTVADYLANGTATAREVKI